MIGKITFLANTTPIIEGIPKIIPVLKSISLSFETYNATKESC
jgi:hypothetical protein